MFFTHLLHPPPTITSTSRYACGAIKTTSFSIFAVVTIFASHFSHVQPLKLGTWDPPKDYKRHTIVISKSNTKAFVEQASIIHSSIVESTTMEQQHKYSNDVNVDSLRSEFFGVLRSRRTDDVPLTMEPAKPVLDPLFQDNPPRSNKVMESTPKADIPKLTELLVEENLYLHTEAGEQGRLPVLILSMKGSNEKKPAVVILHSTGKNKEWMQPLLVAYASRGYVAIAIDSRYHGERANSRTTYQDSLVSAWKKGDTMPFIFDTVWDLVKLADYLTQREDIDPSRIGITGESLGGMHAWFAAFADTRYSVVAPIIGVQGFRWAIDNDKWQARVDSLRPVFEEARIDLGKSEIDKEVVEKVWDRIAPGLASTFDSPCTVPAIALRPFLILNGAEDPRCPISGLEDPVSRTTKIYQEAHVSEKFQLIAQPGIGHQITVEMLKGASDWFDKYL